MPPRSEVLDDVDSLLQAEKIDWRQVAEKLLRVQKLHEQQLGDEEGVLTTPLKGQWKNDKGNKFSRG